MKKTKLTLFIAVLAVALFGMGCGSFQTTETKLKQGLAAYYPFNGDAKDESGNRHHGEVIRAKPSKGRNATDQAFAFDGNARVRLPVFKYGERFTVSLWVLTEGGATGIVFAKKTDTNKESLQISLFERFYIARVYSANDIWVGRTAPRESSSSGIWKHLVVTYDGGATSSSVKIFMDGIRIDSNNHESERKFTKFNDLEIHSEIGSQNRGRDEIKGSIDDVRIYNRALSDEEVKALYDLEKPKGK